MRELLSLINFDNQTSRSVARKLRAEGYFCLVGAADSSAEQSLDGEIKGLVLCGGSTGQPIAIPNLPDYLSSGLPLLALGDAALTLCRYWNGETAPFSDQPQAVQIAFDRNDPLVGKIDQSERYLPAPTEMRPGSNCRVIATCNDHVLGIASAESPVFALAFQVENNDPDGAYILVQFADQICRCTPWWSESAYIDMAVEEIRMAAEGGDGLCAISGGIDSAVCAALGAKALGDRMYCLFVDTGLLRIGEADDAIRNIQTIPGLRVLRVDAREEFLQALEGVSDPAEKQLIVYSRLRAHMRHQVSQMENVRVILQGTNYSDVFGRNISLKTELPSARVRLLEPVRYLFKDEIRRIGEALGLPESLCHRQPFPSAGLAQRIYSAITAERLRILGEADQILREEIEGGGYNKRLWQYYAMMADDPIPGDNGYIVLLRAVQAMESGAVSARLPADVVERIASRILKSEPQVRRVLYDLTPSHTYGRVEWG